MSDQVALTLAQAIQQEQSGQAEAALATFDRAIANGIDAVLIHSNRGLLLDRMGRHAEALLSFRKANVLEPNFRDHYNAGNMLIQLERFEDALSEYDASLSYRDDYPECWTNKGIAHHALDDEEAARTAFDRALQLAPDFLPAHRCLAILHAKQGRLELSAGHYRHVAEAGRSGAAWFEYGCALYKTLGDGPVSFDPAGPEGRAVAAFDATIELQPDNTGAWGRKIGVQFRLADAAQAADRAAASTNPELPKVLPLVLADLAATVAQAVERFPDDPWFAERRADLALYQPADPGS